MPKDFENFITFELATVQTLQFTNAKEEVAPQGVKP